MKNNHNIKLFLRGLISMLDTFTEIKETKKILDKLKKVCSAMSKFNLNSPCLLQFIRINGEYEVILS